MTRTLITGANRGIGRALAELAHAEGHKVIAAMRDPATATDLPQGITRLKLDVTAQGDLDAMEHALASQPLDRLMCNAGLGFRKDRIGGDTGTIAEWQAVMAANVTGVFMTISAALPALRRANGAKISIISSQMGSSTLAAGGAYAYRASKAAALNIGMTLAADLKAEGIAVGIYHPGWVRTDMGGTRADLSAEESAVGLLSCLEALTLDQTGGFFNWDGRPHPV
ncbi:NAD(P)-dependent dehydrogenase (short-subunit alcohol dehydrogenase family) [Rubricella aquisinus]|uniref:NAD(P)-dependent dehydrogenase (Short-subunit alcohol dehydrogenase family) n=1 Tax=Rubricella aquisinus TaxID=2028108 RepID=A0A840WRA4_9RHOB|nr:SDR family NAD(P)-dependent oxidoreductase [Rubricella aquisinus]MBB5516573.1 NAD(P)-dependent dehydrogenase (short-subunit alcohol dehydrogenase family) [Rubricella aquisinus]